MAEALIVTAAFLQQENGVKRSAQHGTALALVVPHMCRLLVSAHPLRHRTVALPLHGLLQADTSLL